VWPGLASLHRSVLGEIAPERQLYLAVPQRVHEGIWTKRFGQLILQSLHLCLIVFDEQQDKDYHVDTLTYYRTIVRKIIEEYASYKPSHGHIETEAIIDSVKEHERGSCGRAV
jgi:XisH protein